MHRLAIVTSHPIQYNAPLFKMLAAQTGLQVKVFYTLGSAYTAVKDKGFGKAITWDIPLLEGYEYEFIQNTALTPGTGHFKGIINPTILKSINSFQPSAVLVFGWSFAGHLKVLKYFKNKMPVYFRGDSTLLDEQPGLKVLLRRLLLKFIYGHIDKAFYVGSNNKAYFLKHGVKELNLIFAPHAIDNRRFEEDADAQEGILIRENLEIPKDHIVFLFAGKFQQKKAPMDLIRAFKKLSARNVSLLFVGNGELESSLKAEAAGFTNIHFLPFQNQACMPAVYRSADVLILPSEGPGETWGLSVNEAMACGLPVIVSDKVGCAVDLVKENVSGFIFKAGHEESLREKLSLCATKSKDELWQMGSVSKTIVNEWSYERVCEAIMKELKSSGNMKYQRHRL